VTYYETKDTIRDYLAFSWHEPERTDRLKELAKWDSADFIHLAPDLFTTVQILQPIK
jgi:hypothetical protein